MPDAIQRVCMFSNLFQPVVSGSATQSAALSRELAARGLEVVIITAHVDPASPPYERVAGVHVYRLPCLRLPRMAIALNFPWLNWTFWPRNVRRIEDILRRHRPQVLHLHNHMFDLAFSAIAMRRRFGLPLVVTIHTMIKHAQRLYNALLLPADRVFLRQAVIRQCDAVISPDYNILDYVREAFGGHRHRVVLYGVESLPEADPERVAQLRRQFQLEGRRVILSLGHVHRIRDRRELVQAMPLVLEQIPEAVLLVVGAVATDIPVRLARELGVEQAVRFVGAQPHADISAFLALGDLEAHWLNQDSPEKTSLGIASLEAMAAGKPVMAVANPDTYGVGVLKSGRNLVVVPPEQPERVAREIIALLRAPSAAAAMGEAARQTIARHFSWRKIGDDTLDVYGEVLGS